MTLYDPIFARSLYNFALDDIVKSKKYIKTDLHLSFLYLDNALFFVECLKRELKNE